MYGVNRGDARAIAPPNARDRSTGDAHTPSMPGDHVGGWADPRAHADGRGPYGRDLRPDRDRTDRFGGKRGWNERGGFPRSTGPLGNGGGLEPQSKRRFPGRPYYGGENGRYGMGLRGAEPGPMVGPGLGGDNGPVPRKFDREAFYNGRAVNGGPFHNGPGGDYRGKDVDERRPFSRDVYTGPGESHDGGGLPLEAGPRAGVYHGQSYGDSETVWDRDGPGRPKEASGWDLPPHDREHRDRGLRLKPEQFLRAGSLIGTSFGGVTQHDVSRDWVGGENDHEGGRVERYSRDLGSRDGLWGADGLGGVREAGSARSWRLHGAKDRGPASGMDAAGSGWSSPSLQSPSSGHGPLRDSVNGVGHSLAGSNVILTSTPQEQPPLSPPGVGGSVRMSEAGTSSPPPKRSRLGWGQGLAKYEKKKVGSDDPASDSSAAHGPGTSSDLQADLQMEYYNSLGSLPPGDFVPVAASTSPSGSVSKMQESTAGEAHMSRMPIERPFSGGENMSLVTKVSALVECTQTQKVASPSRSPCPGDPPTFSNFPDGSCSEIAADGALPEAKPSQHSGAVRWEKQVALPSSPTHSRRQQESLAASPSEPLAACVSQAAPTTADTAVAFLVPSGLVRLQTSVGSPVRMGSSAEAGIDESTGPTNFAEVPDEGNEEGPTPMDIEPMTIVHADCNGCEGDSKDGGLSTFPSAEAMQFVPTEAANHAGECHLIAQLSGSEKVHGDAERDAFEEEKVGQPALEADRIEDAGSDWKARRVGKSVDEDTCRGPISSQSSPVLATVPDEDSLERVELVTLGSGTSSSAAKLAALDAMDVEAVPGAEPPSSSMKAGHADDPPAVIDQDGEAFEDIPTPESLGKEQRAVSVLEEGVDGHPSIEALGNFGDEEDRSGSAEDVRGTSNEDGKEKVDKDEEGKVGEMQTGEGEEKGDVAASGGAKCGEVEMLAMSLKDTAASVDDKHDAAEVDIHLVAPVSAPAGEEGEVAAICEKLTCSAKKVGAAGLREEAEEAAEKQEGTEEGKESVEDGGLQNDPTSAEGGDSFDEADVKAVPEVCAPECHEADERKSEPYTVRRVLENPGTEESGRGEARRNWDLGSKGTDARGHVERKKVEDDNRPEEVTDVRDEVEEERVAAERAHEETKQMEEEEDTEEGQNEVELKSQVDILAEMEKVDSEIEQLQREMEQISARAESLTCAQEQLAQVGVQAGTMQGAGSSDTAGLGVEEFQAEERAAAHSERGNVVEEDVPHLPLGQPDASSQSGNEKEMEREFDEVEQAAEEEMAGENKGQGLPRPAFCASASASPAFEDAMVEGYDVPMKEEWHDGEGGEYGHEACKGGYSPSRTALAAAASFAVPVVSEIATAAAEVKAAAGIAVDMQSDVVMPSTVVKEETGETPCQGYSQAESKAAVDRFEGEDVKVEPGMKQLSLDALLTDTRGGIVDVLQENRHKAKVAHSVIGELLPWNMPVDGTILYASPCEAPAWKANLQQYMDNIGKLQGRVQQECGLQTAVERALAVKYRALRDVWHQDIRANGTRRVERVVKEKVLTKQTSERGRNGCASQPSQRSSLRLRLTASPGGGGEGEIGDTAEAEVPEEQATQAVQRFMSEPSSEPRTILQMPAMMLGDKNQCPRRFMCSNGLVEDPEALERERKGVCTWTEEERQIFLEKYAQLNKNFSAIASFLEHKTVADCVEFYYRNQKSEDFECIRRKQQLKKRRDYSRGASYLATTSMAASRQRDARARQLALGGGPVAAREGMRPLRNTSQRGPDRQRPSAIQPAALPTAWPLARPVVAEEQVHVNLVGASSGKAELLVMQTTIVPVAVQADAPAGDLRAESERILNDTAMAVVGGVQDEGELEAEGSVEDMAASILWSVAQERHGSVPTAVVVAEAGGELSQLGDVEMEGWSVEEEERVLEGVRRCGKDYDSIAEHVGSKSAAQCKAFLVAKKRLLLETPLLPLSAVPVLAPSATEVELGMHRATFGVTGIGGILSPMLLSQLAASAQPQDFVLPLPENLVEAESAPVEEEEMVGSQKMDSQGEHIGGEDREEGEVVRDEDDAEAAQRDDIVDPEEFQGQEGNASRRGEHDSEMVDEGQADEDTGDDMDKVRVDEVDETEARRGFGGNAPPSEVPAGDPQSQDHSEGQVEGGASGRNQEWEEVGTAGKRERSGGIHGGEDGDEEEREGQAMKNPWRAGCADGQPQWVTEWMAARFGKVSLQHGGLAVEHAGREEMFAGRAAAMAGNGEAADIAEKKPRVGEDRRNGHRADEQAASASEAADRTDNSGLHPGSFSHASGELSSWQAMLAERTKEGGLLGNGSLPPQMLLQKPLARTPLAKMQASILSDRPGSRSGAGSPAPSVASGASSGSGGSAPAVTMRAEKEREKDKAGRGGEKDGVKVRREPTSWTPAEKAQFAEIHSKHGKDWARLQEALTNKSMAQIKTYFQNSKAKLGITSGTSGTTGGRGGGRKRKVEETDGAPAAVPAAAPVPHASTQKAGGALEESALKMATSLASTAAGSMAGGVMPSSAPLGSSPVQLSKLSGTGPLGYVPSSLGRASLQGPTKNGMLQMARAGMPGMLPSQLQGMAPPHGPSSAADASGKQAAMAALQQMQMMMQMYHSNGLPTSLPSASMPGMFPSYHPSTLPPLYPQVMPGLGPGPGAALGAASGGRLPGPSSQQQPLQPFKQQRPLWPTMDGQEDQQQGGEGHVGPSRMRPGGPHEELLSGQAAAALRSSTAGFGTESLQQIQHRGEQSSSAPDVKLFGQSLLMQPQAQQQPPGGSGPGGGSRAVPAGLLSAERSSALQSYMMASSSMPSGSAVSGTTTGPEFGTERKLGGQVQYGRTGALPYLMPDSRSTAQQPWGMSMAGGMGVWMGPNPGSMQRSGPGGGEGLEARSDPMMVHNALAKMAERLARDAEGGRQGESVGGAGCTEAHRPAEPPGRKGLEGWADDERGKGEPACSGQHSLEQSQRKDGNSGLGPHRGEMRLEGEQMVGVDAGMGLISSQAFAAFGGDWQGMRSMPTRSGPLGSVGPGRPDTRVNWEEHWREAHVERMGNESQLGMGAMGGVQSAPQLERENLGHLVGSSKGGGAATHNSWGMGGGQPSGPYSSSVEQHQRMVAMAIAAVQQQQQQRASSHGPQGSEDHYRNLDPRESDSRNNGVGNS